MGKEYRQRWAETTDFRVKATIGVALAAVTFLLPIAILNILSERTYVAMGSIFIVIMLVANVIAVCIGKDHEKLTLIGLVTPGMIFMIGVFLHDGFVAAFWCYPSIVACYCMLSQKNAWIATVLILGISLPMAWLTLPQHYAYRVIATLFSVSLFSAILVRVIDTQHKRLQEQVNRDPLTGLLNRLSLKSRLQRAVSDAERDGQYSTLLAIDIDHFKLINDTYGHERGDVVLCTLANLIVENLNSEDACFRTGGEEFLVMLQGMHEKEAFCVAERIRHMLEVSEVIPSQSITASIGIATNANGVNWTLWVKQADDSLYCAKRAGRNRIAIADTTRKNCVPTLTNSVLNFHAVANVRQPEFYTSGF